MGSEAHEGVSARCVTCGMPALAIPMFISVQNLNENFELSTRSSVRVVYKIKRASCLQDFLHPV